MQAKLKEGADVAVNKCMKVGSNDSVLIIADEDSKDIGMAIRKASLEVTERVRFFNLDLPAYGGRPIPGMPESLVDAIHKSSVTFFVAGAREGELQTLREPLIKLVSQKARHAHMVGITNKIMTTGMCVDYDEVYRITKNLQNLLSTTNELHVTSPAGTDFVATLDPRIKWVEDSGVVEKVGDWQNLPSGEVFTAPKSLTGKLVVDGSMGEWIGDKYRDKVNYKETPLEVEVEHNNGGSFLKRVHCDHNDLLTDFKNYVNGDPNASRVGELGLGTNIFLKEIIGNILQDEKFPTVHVAFGDPYHAKTGANWSCNHHIDLLMRKCSVVADGVKIMDKGKYTKEITAKGYEDHKPVVVKK
jgi:leucyl aminopeptidase (aminopeptidase T)